SVLAPSFSVCLSSSLSEVIGVFSSLSLLLYTPPLLPSLPPLLLHFLSCYRSFSLLSLSISLSHGYPCSLLSCPCVSCCLSRCLISSLAHASPSLPSPFS